MVEHRACGVGKHDDLQKLLGAFAGMVTGICFIDGDAPFFLFSHQLMADDPAGGAPSVLRSATSSMYTLKASMHTHGRVFRFLARRQPTLQPVRALHYNALELAI